MSVVDLLYALEDEIRVAAYPGSGREAPLENILKGIEALHVTDTNQGRKGTR